MLEDRNRPTLRKALAIGANEAIRVNATPTDGFFVTSLLDVIKNGLRSCYRRKRIIRL
jgi:electron transfer flavoprotein alpha/beta subunit